MSVSGKVLAVAYLLQAHWLCNGYDFIVYIRYRNTVRRHMDSNQCLARPVMTDFRAVSHSMSNQPILEESVAQKNRTVL